MRHFAMDEDSDIRLLMMDELSLIAGGDGEDGDEEASETEEMEEIVVTATTQDYIRAWADGWSESFHTGAVVIGTLGAISLAAGAVPVATAAGATAAVGEGLSLAAGAVASALSQ